MVRTKVSGSTKATLKRLLSMIRHRTAKIGHNSYVHLKSSFTSQSTLGKYSYINSNTYISAADIGNYCSISANVGIGLGEHDIDGGTSKALSSRSLLHKRTSIGHEVWIGFGAVIIQGVKIGNGAIIGANSVVTKDVPAYAIVAGVPAKTLRFRYSDEEIALRRRVIDYAAEPEIVKTMLHSVIARRP